MKTMPTFRMLGSLLALAALTALATPAARAANTMQFFFPVDHEPFSHIDDEIVVKSIFWSDESQPIQWILMAPSGRVILSISNPLNMTPDDVEFAIEDALKEWNRNELSSFRFEDDIFQSISPIVEEPGPQDIAFDNYNVMSFLSSTVTPESGAAFGIALFFMEKDLEVDTFGLVPTDAIEMTSDAFLIDFDEDGILDIEIPIRDYEQAEIIEADIAYNSAVPFVDWPDSYDEIPDAFKPLVPTVADVQAVATQALGFAQGLTLSYLADASLQPSLLSEELSSFVLDPFDIRDLEFDDKLAGALLYPGDDLSSLGTLQGTILDGQFIDALESEAPPPINALTLQEQFVVMAPVFLGVPAPPNEIHPDNAFATDREGNPIVLRLIAQVLSGQSLTYPAGDIEGAGILEPGSDTDANIDFEDTGEWAFDEELGLYIPTLDLNNNGVYDFPTTDIDGDYKFVGLKTRDDYAVYIDPDRFGDTANSFTLLNFPAYPIINNVIGLLSEQESFPPEFYGGAPESAFFVDTQNDARAVVEFVSVVEGEVTSGIDIITNTGDPDDEEIDPGTTPTTGGSVDRFEFARDQGAIVPSDYVAIGGDMGDLNGDGYLDFVVATFSGGSDPNGGRINRVFINEPRNTDPPGRFFRDVTFGFDGVPGTSDDVLPAHIDISRDAKLGDFNNDGRLDLFVSNGGVNAGFLGITGGKNRLYVNEPVSTNPWGLRFRDVSSQVLPGVLNHPWEIYQDDSGRAAVGDIDNDGDLDIIVSQFEPLTDWDYEVDPEDGSLTLRNFPTSAIVDVDPSAAQEDPPNDGRGDHMYDPEADYINARSYLYFTERVLINQQGVGPVGFSFIDDTLGADNRFGDSKSFSDASYGFPIIDPSLYTFDPFNSDEPNPRIDRMPPVFPPVLRFDAMGQPTGAVSSPMGLFAMEPLLGPMVRDGSLDLLSVRMFDGGCTCDNVFNGSQAGFFENLDLTGDGQPDGYFGALNYDYDFLFRAGSGLYPYTVVVEDGQTTVRLYNLPLLIGVPNGMPGDYTSSQPTIEGDFFEVVQRGSFTGVIEDFEYRGAPKPLILADSSYGGNPFHYRANDSAFDGLDRGQSALVVGVGLPYFTSSFLEVLDISVGIVDNDDIVSRDLPDYAGGAGEPHGSVAADFDLDGDFDLMVAINVNVGFQTNRVTVVGEAPSPNMFYENNGFAEFTDATAEALPGRANDGAYSYAPLAGDIDNDGDVDMVVINAFGAHHVLINQAYSPVRAPDLESTIDSTLFADQTQAYLAPAVSGALSPPFGTFLPPGSPDITTKTTTVGSADINLDGLSDLLAADGGIFSLEKDVVQVHLNSGPARAAGRSAFNMGTKRFTPYGAPYPGPQINYLGAPVQFAGALFDSPGAYYGIAAGDFSGDGFVDFMFSRNGGGPVGYMNIDSSLVAALGYFETDFISEPDADNIPDGILFPLQAASLFTGFDVIPALIDPCVDTVSEVVRKRMGRRMVAADFDGNDTLDLVIANGLQIAGAPNVLLLNFPIFDPLGLTTLPFFVDVTESNLPTAPGVCGLPEGIHDNTYAVGAADFDHDGDIDIVFANQTDPTTDRTLFPGFRYLTNDGSGVFTDTLLTAGNLPSQYYDSNPRHIVVADLDGVGEWTEDLNNNKALDFGEDFNSNGLLDRSEDRNGNGVLDPGEDLPEDINGDGVLQSWEDRNFNSVLDYSGDGILTWVDLPDEGSAGDINGDGIITSRQSGVWEPSFDMFITRENTQDILLINDPTNTQPGIFSDESETRLPPVPIGEFPDSRGARAGDVDLDGDLDIVVTKFTINTFMRPIQFLRNEGGGVFTDRSHEVPFSSSVRNSFETPTTPSTAGNPQDVELVDVDNDGDLDMFVGMAGPNLSLVAIGATNVVYINRIIGGNWNEGYRRIAEQEDAKANATPRAPVIFFANPANALQGQNVTVTLVGANFEPDTGVNFGAGITVNSAVTVGTSVLHATISVDSAAEIGPRSVLATNNGSGLSTKTEPGVFNIKGLAENDANPEEWLRYE